MIKTIKRLLRKLTTGADVYDLTDVDTTEYVIRFKDIYLVVDEMSDGNYSVSWMRSPMGHVPIRDYWTASSPAKEKPLKAFKTFTADTGEKWTAVAWTDPQGGEVSSRLIISQELKARNSSQGSKSNNKEDV